jgi:hypothetical protein
VSSRPTLLGPLMPSDKLSGTGNKSRLLYGALGSHWPVSLPPPPHAANLKVTFQKLQCWWGRRQGCLSEPKSHRNVDWLKMTRAGNVNMRRNSPSRRREFLGAIRIFIPSMTRNYMRKFQFLDSSVKFQPLHTATPCPGRITGISSCVWAGVRRVHVPVGY